MPRGDFHGGKNAGLPMRTRDAPTRSFAVLDKGRSLAPTFHVTQTHSKPKNNRVLHVEDGTPVGYSQMFEAYVSYAKDRWCSPSCQCLHYAAASGNEVLTEAAAEGRKPFTRKHGLEERDDAGRTAIMVAAWKGHANCVRLLAAHGANLNAVDKRSRTVAHWAGLSTNAYEVLVPLCGKNLDTTKKDLFGDTCLHKIVVDRDIKTAELLCQHFPRLTTVKNKAGKLPMELAEPNKALVNAVSPKAAAQHFKDEKDKVLKMAMETEESEKLEIQKQQVRQLEDQIASAASTSGVEIEHNSVQNDKIDALADPVKTDSAGTPPVSEDKDERVAQEGGTRLQHMAGEGERIRMQVKQASGEDDEEELPLTEGVSVFSAMVDAMGRLFEEDA